MLGEPRVELTYVVGQLLVRVVARRVVRSQAHQHDGGLVQVDGGLEVLAVLTRDPLSCSRAGLRNRLELAPGPATYFAKRGREPDSQTIANEKNTVALLHGGLAPNSACGSVGKRVHGADAGQDEYAAE